MTPRCGWGRGLAIALALASCLVAGPARGQAAGEGGTRDALDGVPPPPPTVPDEDRPKARTFIKGELTRVGASELALARRRLGVLTGYELIEEVQPDGNVDAGHYLRITPSLDFAWREGKVRLGLGIPLRLLIYGPGGFSHAGQIRAKDWDEPSDFARVLRYLTYGGKEQRLFFQVSQLDAATIGHGPILRRYFANADLDARRVGMELDTYGKLAGFELHVSDLVTPFELLARPENNVGFVAGGIGFLKPLALVSDALAARTLSIGVTWVGDLNAPLSLSYDAIGRAITEPDTLRPVFDGGLVDLFGVDMEVKVLKTPSADLKPFIDLSVRRAPFLAGRGGWGGTLGLLGRFNLQGEGKDARVHALRAILEARLHAGNYIPAYFDTFYEVEKFAYVQDASRGGRWITKVEALDARDPSRLERGLYLELSWAPQGLFAAGTALELSTAPRGNNFYLHFEVPAGRFFQLLLTYHKRGFAGASEFFDLSGDDNILVAAARVEILPILWLNLRAYQAFQFNDADPTRKVFETVRGVQLEVELGWELASPKEPTVTVPARSG